MTPSLATLPMRADEIGLRCSRDEAVELLFQTALQVIPTAGEPAKR